jgi:hypothetical protein
VGVLHLNRVELDLCSVRIGCFTLFGPAVQICTSRRAALVRCRILVRVACLRLIRRRWFEVGSNPIITLLTNRSFRTVELRFGSAYRTFWHRCRTLSYLIQRAYRLTQ